MIGPETRTMLAARWETIERGALVMLRQDGRVTARFTGRGRMAGVAVQRLAWWWPWRTIAVCARGVAVFAGTSTLAQPIGDPREYPRDAET